MSRRRLAPLRSRPAPRPRTHELPARRAAVPPAVSVPPPLHDLITGMHFKCKLRNDPNAGLPLHRREVDDLKGFQHEGNPF